MSYELSVEQVRYQNGDPFCLEVYRDEKDNGKKILIGFVDNYPESSFVYQENIIVIAAPKGHGVRYLNGRLVIYRYTDHNKHLRKEEVIHTTLSNLGKKVCISPDGNTIVALGNNLLDFNETIAVVYKYIGFTWHEVKRHSLMEVEAAIGNSYDISFASEDQVVFKVHGVIAEPSFLLNTTDHSLVEY